MPAVGSVGQGYHAPGYKPPRKPPPAPTPSYPNAVGGSGTAVPSSPSPSPSVSPAAVAATSAGVGAGASGSPRPTAATLADVFAPTTQQQLAQTNLYLQTVESLQQKYLGGIAPPLQAAATAIGQEVGSLLKPKRRIDENVGAQALAKALSSSASQVGATADFAAGRAQAGPSGPAYPNAVLEGRGIPAKPSPIATPNAVLHPATPAAPRPAAPASAPKLASVIGANVGQGAGEKVIGQLQKAAGRSTPVSDLIGSFVDPVTGMKLTDSPYAEDIARGAIAGQRKYGVPASVTLAVTGQESGYGTNRGPSSADAVGIGQGIPDTRNAQVAAGGPDFWAGEADPNNPTGHLAPKDAREQTKAAAYLLGSSLDSGSTLEEALNSYTGGYGDVYNDPVNQRAREFKALDKAKAFVPIPDQLKARAQQLLGRQNTKEIIQGSREGAGTPVSGTPSKVVLPVKGKIIGVPNQGTHTLGNWQSDNAVDIAVPNGTPIRAAEGGTVDKVYRSSADPNDQMAGWQITINGDTFYTHLEEANVQEGDTVKPGDVIGLSGSANGVAHLHFATKSGDPQEIISKAPAASAEPPAKEIHKWVQLTESPEEQGAEQGVAPGKAYKVTIRRMSPTLQSALVKLGKQTGIPVRVNEGFRTAARADDFPSGLESQHHQGNAVDVDNNADYTPEQLAAAGLNNTAVSGEPWHFQPNDEGSYTSTSTTGGGTTAAAPTSSAGTTSATAATGAGGQPMTPFQQQRQTSAAQFGTFQPMPNALAAHPVLPSLGGITGGSNPLADILGGAASADDSEQATALERFRPQRRLR